MAFVTARPPFFLPCMHTHVCLRGMLPQTRSEAGKFCILETESSNLGNTFKCKFNKGDENKISFLQARPTQLCIIWMNFIGGQGWYRLLSTYSNTEGDISYKHPLYKSAPLALLTNAKRSGGILSVRCNAGPAEGPGKILKYRSNLRLYPVNFGNKLCILIFIILSIWPNFFDPTPFTKENFLVPPPSGNSKLFGPPSILPSPPTKVFMNAPL